MAIGKVKHTLQEKLKFQRKKYAIHRRAALFNRAGSLLTMHRVIVGITAQLFPVLSMKRTREILSESSVLSEWILYSYFKQTHLNVPEFSY